MDESVVFPIIALQLAQMQLPSFNEAAMKKAERGPNADCCRVPESRQPNTAASGLVLLERMRKVQKGTGQLSIAAGTHGPNLFLFLSRH